MKKDIIACIPKQMVGSNQVKLKIFCSQSLSDKTIMLLKNLNETLFSFLPKEEVDVLLKTAKPTICFMKKNDNIAILSNYIDLMKTQKDLLKIFQQTIVSINRDFASKYDVILIREVFISYGK